MNFKEFIATKQKVLMDGAIGTELYNRGFFINRCYEEINLTDKKVIRTLHHDYLKAGAQALLTNTWGANRLKLKTFSLANKLVEINTAGVELAQSVSKEVNLWILGSVGPLGVRLEPFGPTSYNEARDVFREQIKTLIVAGVSGISLETFSDLAELHQAILAVRDIDQEIPLLAHLAINENGQTLIGTPINWAAKKMSEWQVDILGFNCSVGPQPMLSYLDDILSNTQKPISVKPNAGLPKLVDGRRIYMCSPEYMAHFTQEFFAKGVQFVGGCCGTSPIHIKAMANVVRYSKAVNQLDYNREPKIEVNSLSDKQRKAKVSFEKKSEWSSIIAAGKKVYSVELLPPLGPDPTTIIKKAIALKKAGVHAINIPDGPRASSRMSAVLTAVMIEQQAKIETVLHYTCRDRNLLGIQSDLIGMHAIGLRNVLVVTGDPPKVGNYPDVTGVFDVDAIGLTNLASQLNNGTDLGGKEISMPLALSIGVGSNPVHRDFSYEMNRFRWKVKAGAEWTITQPVFDLEALYRFLEYINKERMTIPVVAGIWPLVSYKNALFMNNEVPGVVIPSSVMARMEKAKDAEDAKKIGVDIAARMVDEIKGNVQGIQVSAPFGKVELALGVLGL